MISRDNCNAYLVAVDCNMEGIVNAGVDQANAVLLALRHLRDSICTTRGALHCAIDQGCVWHGWRANSVQSTDIQCESSIIIPVRHRQDAHVVVVIGRCWAVDDDGADHAVAVLRGEVAARDRKLVSLGSNTKAVMNTVPV